MKLEVTDLRQIDLPDDWPIRRHRIWLGVMASIKLGTYVETFRDPVDFILWLEPN